MNVWRHGQVTPHAAPNLEATGEQFGYLHRRRPREQLLPVHTSPRASLVCIRYKYLATESYLATSV